MNRPPCALLCFLLMAGSALAAESVQEGEPAAGTQSSGASASGLRHGIRILAADARWTFAAPARWRGRGWSVFASVLAATGAALALDDEVRREVRESSSDDRQDAADRIEWLGRAEVGALLPWISYGGAALAGSDRFKRTSLVAFEAWLLTGAATAALKGAAARLGPTDGEVNDFWKGGDAFPSGHTSRTFAIAAVFAGRHGRRAAWIGYPIAALVGLARIETDAHWASDVVAGAALGIAVGSALARRHPVRDATGDLLESCSMTRESARPLAWQVWPVGGGVVVRLSF